MTDELENALAEEFPFMRWVPEDGGRWIGIFCDCEDGWCPLIREMCREITTAMRRSSPSRRSIWISTAHRSWNS